MIKSHIQGTHATFKPYLEKDELAWAEDLGTSWYKVKERVPINAPFNSGEPLSNKKWPFNEERRNIYNNNKKTLFN